ncbi:craniofacial development protein 2-like [Artemia franciscana]|uniref:craniofacial development protein 2-like n=1 Tax=Artemia franciscana TaxID=6661 RepID=UPI0032DA0F63
MNKIPRKDILVIGGDFNARIGTRLNDSEWAIGNHGLGDRCINGVRLLMFSMLNNLNVANTWFKHKPCHTYTWRSRDGRTNAQIDYLLVSRHWKSMIKDSRVYRGADTGSKSGSDHLLLKSKVRFRLSSKKVSAPRRILDTTKLKLPEIKETFMLELTNRFTALQDNDREFKTNQCSSQQSGVPSCSQLFGPYSSAQLQTYMSTHTSHTKGIGQLLALRHEVQRRL